MTACMRTWQVSPFLKKWIYKPGIEEVNINAFDDIEVIMSGGRSMKIPDCFQSPQHAIDVTRRLLNTCGMVIDDTMPSVIGFLDKNIRISVDKTPIVDADVGINASIRIVNQQTVSKEKADCFRLCHRGNAGAFNLLYPLRRIGLHCRRHRLRQNYCHELVAFHGSG